MGVRVHLGKLSNGDYGLEIRNAAGTVIFRTSTSGVDVGPTQVKITTAGLVVNDGLVDRVIVGEISGTPDYGLKVQNAGATVIIDGQSNHFKIAASGTLSGTKSTGSDGLVQSVELTALGSQSVIPAHLAYLSFGTGVATDYRLQGAQLQRTALWAAVGSGGTTTYDFVAIHVYARIGVKLTAIPGNVLVDLHIDNHSGADKTAYAKYYVLQEAAM